MATADYIGICTLITSLGAAIVSIIVALRQTQTHAQLDRVATEVTTANGKSVANIIEGYEDRRVADGGR